MDHGSKLVGCIGICFLESIHHAAVLYLQVPLLIVPLGCTGRFVRSIVRRAPALLHPQPQRHRWYECINEVERHSHITEGV